MTASMLWRSAVLEVDKLLLFDLDLEFHHFHMHSQLIDFYDCEA